MTPVVFMADAKTKIDVFGLAIADGRGTAARSVFSDSAARRGQSLLAARREQRAH
jgi:hypothetical protein